MSRPRRIHYISGTRADFGLMRSTLQKIHAEKGLALSVVATGMHLSERYGNTVAEIAAAGLPEPVRVPVDDDIPSGPLMARNLGRMLTGFVDVFENDRPDVVLLLGDRGEMLAGALAAIHLNIPIAHVHGGERSGTVDEPIRHAISKLSHIHLVATQESADRLIRMGEPAAAIHVVGAPGLDGLAEAATKGRAVLARQLEFDAGRPVALFVFHPVLQEAQGAAETELILQVLAEQGFQVVALAPNSDSGSADVLSVLERQAAAGGIRLLTHLLRDDFVSMLKVADLMIGNSSSGIIEAATFGTPVINVGSRQNLRQRNRNVVDCPATWEALVDAIAQAQAAPRTPGVNVYGDGHAGERIVAHLLAWEPGKTAIAKANVY